MKRPGINSDTRVLIVDDSPQYASVLQKILSAGIGVKSVEYLDRTEKAVARLEGAPEEFDLLFIDYRFPDGKTGVDLLQKLTDAGLLKDKVAFLITSEPSPDNVKRAMAAGARGVVAKPFDRLQLQTQLERLDRLLTAPKEE